jgi:hypothetical protein
MKFARPTRSLCRLWGDLGTEMWDSETQVGLGDSGGTWGLWWDLVTEMWDLVTKVGLGRWDLLGLRTLL